MADAKQASPKQVTFYGRLSFPVWTAQAAYDKSQTGDYKAKDVASAAPDFTLLVEQSQLDKVRDHVLNTFLPYCVQQEQNGEKKDVLTKKEADDLAKQIKKSDFDGVYNTPFKPVHEKTAELAPECVAAIKVIGNKGQDFELRAIVRDEDELSDAAKADGDTLTFPTVKPLSDTIHSMYPGCYVAVTVNLYAYHNGKLPGFSAGGSVAVFKADAERFGGGVTVDEEEIFLD